MSEATKDAILVKIAQLFGDTSVSAETTAEHMKEIIQACQENLQALKEDGVEF